MAREGEIDSTGRGKLNDSERTALSQQHRNREAVGAPFEDREARMNELRQTGGTKAPRYFDQNLRSTETAPPKNPFRGSF
jgi:hypothetical protein